jgi:hypothetical protein
MPEDLSFLADEADNIEAPEGDSLQRITDLANRLKEAITANELAEANAKATKALVNKLSMELLPEAMLEIGMTSFELATGEKVSYQEKLSTTCKDTDKLVKFLEDRGDDGIVKVSIELGKTPQNILNSIVKDLADKYGLLADVKQGVHHSTLTSYFSELCGIKKNTVAKMGLAELDETMVNAYTYYKTKIK